MSTPSGLQPFILYGDGPRLPTGLARIARDLAMRLVAESDELGIRFAQVGVDYPGGWHWQPWDFSGFQPNPSDQGREAVELAVAELARECGRRPIVLMIMDPARCYDLTRAVPDGQGQEWRIDAELWGYYPLDAHNRLECVGGPAGKAVEQTDRVLGYGRYGATLLQRTLQRLAPDTPVAVAHLPHGLDTRTFYPGATLDQADPSFQAWAAPLTAYPYRIGAVATNQPRKDLGLFFSILADLRARGHAVAGWLHTDKLTAAWDIGELVQTCGLRRDEIAVSIEDLTDQQLAARYAWSTCTIAPGLGEGFGYPIVESLACGTPVVHGNYAGGVELIPTAAWLIPVAAWRLESVYVLLRPVFDPRTGADVVAQVHQSTPHGLAEQRAYCAGAMRYLDWEHLWPRWRSWIRVGLREKMQRDRNQIGQALDALPLPTTGDTDGTRRTT